MAGQPPVLIARRGPKSGQKYARRGATVGLIQGVWLSGLAGDFDHVLAPSSGARRGTAHRRRTSVALQSPVASVAHPTHGGRSKLPTDDIQRHLESMFGPGAAFREGQREAIEAVIDDGSRALVVQRTGWGKSLVYWIATRVRRDAGHGPTLIISPLLALMRNQIAMAAAVRAPRGDDQLGNVGEWAGDRASGSARDEIDVLLISPERLANEGFATDVLPRDPGLDRAVRRRRGALHLGLGPRLPAGLPADRPDPAELLDPRRAGPRDDRDRQRPRRRRRRRAARRRRRGHPRPAGPRLAPARRDRRWRTRPSGSPGSPSRSCRGCRAAASSTASRSPTRERVATFLTAAGHRRPRLQRAALDRGARGARGRARSRTR